MIVPSQAPWTRKPPANALLDLNHSLVRGMHSCYAIREDDTTEHLTDAIGGNHMIRGNATHPGFILPSGRFGWRANAPTGVGDLGHWKNTTSTLGAGQGKFTLVCAYRINAHQGSGGWAFIKGNGQSSSQIIVGFKDYTNNHYFQIGSGGATYTAIGAAALSVGQIVVCVGTFDRTLGADRVKLYDDGVLVATGTGLDADMDATQRDVKISHGSNSGNRQFSGDVFFAAGWHGRAFTQEEARWITDEILNNTWGFFSVPSLWTPLIAPAAGGPQTFFQDTAGALSFLGTLNKESTHSLAGTLSFVGDVNKETRKLVVGTLSFSGITDTTLLFTQSAEGSLSFSGALAKETGKLLTGVLTTNGVITREIQKQVNGELAFLGGLTRETQKLLAGALTLNGDLGALVVFTKDVNGTLSFVGTIVRGMFVETEGALTFSGDMAKLIQKSLSGTLTFSGNLTRLIEKKLAGELSFVGNLAASLLFSRAVSGTLSFVGGLATLFIPGGAGPTLRRMWRSVWGRVWKAQGAGDLVFFDGFERAGPGLGSNWTNPSTGVPASPPRLPIEIVTQGTVQPTVSGDWCDAAYTGAPTPNDQFAEATVAVHLGGVDPFDFNNGLGVYVRATLNVRAAYFASIWYSLISGDRYWEFGKLQVGAAVYFDWDQYSGSPWPAGTRVRLEAIGTTIKFYLDGVLTATQIDSENTSGNPCLLLTTNLGEEDEIQVESFRSGPA